MKQKTKKLFMNLFGNDTNITFKVSLSSLITGIIFLLFSIASPENSTGRNILPYIAALFFSIWMIITKGANTIDKIAIEALRLLIFFILFISSMFFFLKMDSFNGILLIVLTTMFSIAVFLCCIYVVFKLSDIFDFAKKLFIQIKEKLFNSKKPANSKITAVIENITVFLVSIGGFGIAIKTIIETIFQTASYFK